MRSTANKICGKSNTIRVWCNISLCIGQFQLRPCPPSPWANPRGISIFFWEGKFPGVGALKMPNARGCGDEGRGQIPCPQDRTSPINAAVVSIHCIIVPLSAFKGVSFRFCTSASLSSNRLFLIIKLKSPSNDTDFTDNTTR